MSAKTASPLAQLRARLLRGRQSGWAMAEYFAYPLMMFLATPIFLYLLGTVQYGQWMLLLTFNGLGGLAGLGMGTAAIKEVSAHRGRGDIAGAADAVRNCLAITLLSSIALSSILILIGLFAGPNLLAKMGDPDVVRNIIVAAAILIALEQVDTVFAGSLRGMERFDISARIEASAKLIMVVAALTAAWITRQLESVIWTTIAITVLRAGIKAVIAARLLAVSSLWPKWERAHISRVFAFGKWTWAQSIGAALFATADRMIVSSVLGAEALARYSICLQLAQQIQTVPAAGAQVLFPMISRRMEQGEDVRRVAIKAMAMLTLFAAFVAAPVIIFSHLILSVWIGEEIADQSAYVLALLAAGFALLAVNVVPHFVLLGLDKASIVATVNIVAGIIAVSVCVLTIESYGLVAACIGRVAYALVTLNLVPILLRSPAFQYRRNSSGAD